MKRLLYLLHLDLTRNQQYDRQTARVMQKVLKRDSHCIDIGCHLGEMLDLMFSFSPEGPHWAFEPLPQYYQGLQKKYIGKNAHLYPFALSDTRKKINFHHVVNDPAYSGILQRRYKVKKPDIQLIEVDTECLDNLIPENIHIDFMKIDVEGGEYGVLKGAVALLKRDKPFIIFEFGLGAADYYGTTPEMMFELFHSCDMRISLMSDFLRDSSCFDKNEFCHQFQTGSNYYFIAHP
ncbi:MAG: FkbM family methyltransferase [Bacteroidetes bacterium]|nr:FkbM family methyltransferase [Bacteroidota bacterium]